MQALIEEDFAEKALRVFHAAVIAYAIYWIWSLDWQVYLTMAGTLYRPIGLAALLQIPFPSAAALWSVRLATTALALLSWRSEGCVGRITLGLGFALGLFLLDLWHNQFGFIDERIHLVWFAVVLALRPLGREWVRRLFTACELVVVTVYLQSAFAKLWISGVQWAMSGTTLQIAWIRRGVPLGVLASHSSALAIALSCLALCLELSFAAYFLIGRGRIALLAMSLAFHLGTWLTMGIAFTHLWLFAASVCAVWVWNQLGELRSEDRTLGPIPLKIGNGFVGIPGTRVAPHDS